MKLSEAIREGCKYGPQIKMSLKTQDGYCAIGGALESTGKGEFKGAHGNAVTLWPWVKVMSVCPHIGCELRGKENSEVIDIVSTLNDHHGWSREAIAEWVETVERKLGLWDEPKADAPVVQEAIKASMETVKTFSGG